MFDFNVKYMFEKKHIVVDDLSHRFQITLIKFMKKISIILYSHFKNEIF